MTFQFRLIKLWEKDARDFVASLGENEVELLPFVPLMDGGLELIEMIEDRIYTSNRDRDEKADLLTAMAIFSSLRKQSIMQLLLNRRKDIMIESPAYAYIKEEGRKEGQKEGILEGKLEDARNMLKKGYPLEDVLEITGLSAEDLRKEGILE